MKKNIGLVVLGILLIFSGMIGFVKTQSLEKKINQAQTYNASLQKKLSNDTKETSSLNQQLTALTKLKTGYVIDGMTATVSRFFQDAFTFKANVNDYAKRKNDAKAIAAEIVVDQFFTEDESEASSSPSFVDSSAQNIKVYIENTRNSVTTGIVTYTLNNKVGTSLDKSSIMYYQFTYDSGLNQLLSAKRMERFVADDN